MNYRFSVLDIIWAVKEWKLQKLTNKEKSKIINYLINKNNTDQLNNDDFIYGEKDIESFILHIISED